MRYAIIENGKVVNIAAATAEFAASQGWVECPDGVGIGWSFDGGNPIPPPRDIEGEWNQIRMRRDFLLIQSDSAVLPDRWAAITLEKQEAWSTYRQVLRDIPQSFSDPKDVIWPTKPESDQKNAVLPTNSESDQKDVVLPTNSESDQKDAVLPTNP